MPDLDEIRSCFPTLERVEAARRAPVVYLDGPAGSQVPRQVQAAVLASLGKHSANRSGCFPGSRETDAMFAMAHQTLADFLGAADADEIVFGANMTSLTFALSRAIARTWKPGDEIIVSRLDHAANVDPWVLAAQDCGAVVRHIDVHLEDCTLDLDSFDHALSERTRLVAVGYASNATGTINPVAELVRRAKSVGAMTFIDAVHFAPHGLLDVQAIGCDFLVCSAYKFFGPHVGFLWGRRELLETLQPYKLRPAPESIPGRWMTGTQSHEGISGAAAAVDYLVEISGHGEARAMSRRARLTATFDWITAHERALVRPLLDYLVNRDDVRVWGITDPARHVERVPTVSITHRSRTPWEMAEALAARDVWAWHGNHYALPFTETAGLEPHGTLRMGMLHYNTVDEVQRVIRALDDVLGE